MKNDNNKLNDNLNQASNMVILKPAGSARQQSQDKKRISDERRSLLKDLAIMAIISAVVIAGLIIFELLLKPRIFS